MSEAAREVRIVRHDYVDGPQWSVFVGDDWWAAAHSPEAASEAACALLRGYRR